MNTRFKKNIIGILMLAMIMALASAGWAYDVQESWIRFSATAGETLATGQIACIKAADGKAYKAKADDAALRPAVGVIRKGGASGVVVEIVTQGRFTGWTGLSKGAWTYLSATAGAATQSGPAYSQIIGFAINATDYYFNFSNYLDTSSLTALGTLTGAMPLIFEGATADAYQTTIAVTDPTAARTVTIPNKSGQVKLSSAASVLTPGAAVTLTVGLSNLYTLATNDNEDTTITFSGAGTSGDGLTIVIATSGTADEIITFHATLVSSTGTLTAGATAGRFYAIRFISDGSHWYEVCRTAVQT